MFCNAVRIYGFGFHRAAPQQSQDPSVREEEEEEGTGLPQRGRRGKPVPGASPPVTPEPPAASSLPRADPTWPRLCPGSFSGHFSTDQPRGVAAP